MPITNVKAILVQSDNIEWVGYPRTGEPMMIVKFKNSGKYAYLGVSRQSVVHAAYAKSTGSYIARKIKPNYDVVKLA